MAAEPEPSFPFLRHLFWAVKDGIVRVGQRRRRLALVVRLRAHAFAQRASLRLELSPDLRLGSGIKAQIQPRTRNAIQIGPRSTLGDRLLFVLGGGEVLLGEQVDIRRDTVLTVSGRLCIEGHNVIQPGTGIHCDDAVTIRWMASIGERTTIIDSAHYFTEPDAWFGHNVKTGPIEIGYNAWVGANATIARNVTVGDHAVVAANSLVVRDVPPGHVASGVPATSDRRLSLPWRDGDAGDPADRTVEGS